MKTNSDYILRKIVDDQVLIPTGAASERINGMIHLTETAAFIWNQVDTASNLEDIVNRMLEEFDVSEEIAKTDVFGFLVELYKREMVYDIPEFENIDFSDHEEEQI